MWRLRLPSFVLALSGLALIGVGWTGLTDPAGLMRPLGISLDVPSAHNEVRAAYGGMHAALGLFLVVAAARPALRSTGLWVNACIMGGLVAGRLASLVVDGPAGGFVLLLLAVEALAAIASGLALASGLSTRSSAAAHF